MDKEKRQELIKKLEYEIHVMQRLKETLESDNPTLSQEEVEAHFRQRREARNTGKAV